MIETVPFTYLLRKQQNDLLSAASARYIGPGRPVYVSVFHED
jgi:hypothetical protein